MLTPSFWPWLGWWALFIRPKHKNEKKPTRRIPNQKTSPCNIALNDRGTEAFTVLTPSSVSPRESKSFVMNDTGDLHQDNKVTVSFKSRQPPCSMSAAHNHYSLLHLPSYKKTKDFPSNKKKRKKVGTKGLAHKRRANVHRINPNTSPSTLVHGATGWGPH